MGLWFLILGHSLRRLPAFSGEREQADECPLAGARGLRAKGEKPTLRGWAGADCSAMQPAIFA